MPITVKFFASLREHLGRSEDRVQAAPGMTVQDVWTRVSHGLPLPANILIAVNQDYATLAAPVHDGDEVAFFPPITGGCPCPQTPVHGLRHDAVNSHSDRCARAFRERDGVRRVPLEIAALGACFARK